MTDDPATRPTIPAPSSAAEAAFTAGLPGPTWGKPRKPLRECYGRWRVIGPSVCINGRWHTTVECTVHCVRRSISESKLRTGVAQQCAECARPKQSTYRGPR